MVSEKQLRSLDAFSSLPHAALAKLAKGVTHESYADGAVIFVEGKRDDAVYFVSEGEVLIRKMSDKAKGTYKTLSLLGPGEFFGEMALIEGAPRSAEAVARGTVSLTRLPGAEFNRLIKQNPRGALELFRRLVVTISTRLRKTTREMVVLFEVARVLASAREVQPLTAQLLAHLGQAFAEGVFGLFYVWNEFNMEYDCLAVEGDVPAALQRNRAKSDPLIRALLSQRECLSSDAWEKDVRFTDAEKKEWPEIRSLMVSPVFGARGMSAFVVFGHSQKGALFVAQHRQVLSSVTQLAAAALDNAALRQEEESRRRLGRTKLPYA